MATVESRREAVFNHLAAKYSNEIEAECLTRGYRSINLEKVIREGLEKAYQLGLSACAEDGCEDTQVIPLKYIDIPVQYRPTFDYLMDYQLAGRSAGYLLQDDQVYYFFDDPLKPESKRWDSASDPRAIKHLLKMGLLEESVTTDERALIRLSPQGMEVTDEIRHQYMAHGLDKCDY